MNKINEELFKITNQLRNRTIDFEIALDRFKAIITEYKKNNHDVSLINTLESDFLKILYKLSIYNETILEIKALKEQNILLRKELELINK